MAGTDGKPCRGAYFRYPSRHSSVTSSSLLDFALVLVLVGPVSGVPFVLYKPEKSAIPGKLFSV
jgi:hypothetical protein